MGACRVAIEEAWPWAACAQASPSWYGRRRPGSSSSTARMGVGTRVRASPDDRLGCGAAARAQL